MEKNRQPKALKKGGIGYQHELSFIRMVVSEYLNGTEGYIRLSRRFNVSTTQVRNWVKKFSSDLVAQSSIIAPMTEQEQQELEALKKRQKELEKQLELANMKIFGLQTFIDIAEETLNIEIRKKSGPKQSEK